MGLDGTFKLVVTNFTNILKRFSAGVQLQDGTILFVSNYGQVVQLNEDGSVKMVVSSSLSTNGIGFSDCLCQLQDGTILVGTYAVNAKIYELNHK